MSMILEGYIEFDNSIPVTMNCLGKQFPIEIAGFKGFLATPNMFKGFYEDNKLGPLESPNAGEIKFIDEFYWGSVNSWPKGFSLIRACKLIFPDVQKESYEIIGNKIALEIGTWRSRLIDNVSIFMRKDYRGPARSKTVSSFGIGEFALFREKTGSNNTFMPDQYKILTVSIELNDFQCFNNVELQHVLDNSSNRKLPLLPFYFFIDAERARFDEDFRKSVLDSATAVEVCFALIIGKLLPPDDDLNKYIYSKIYSLKQKRELLRVFKLKLPEHEKNYSKNLDEIRNKVIHAGYIPNKNEANTALIISEKTLYTLLT